MKTKVLYIAMLAIMIAGCSNELQQEETLCTIKTVVESPHTTRSIIDGNGRFSWTESDYIGIFGSQSQNVMFRKAGAMTYEYDFIGMLDTRNEQMLFGYYPYSKDTKLEGGNLYLELKDGDVFPSENRAPMAGLLGKDNTLNFRQMCGVLHVCLTGMSELWSQVKVESLGDNRNFLSGKAVIENIQTNPTELRIVEGTYQRTFNLSFLPNPSTFYDMYIPLQPGYYSELKITMIDNSGQEILTKSLTDINIKRAVMIETPVIAH